jgi:hypothetical protein
VRMMDEGRGAMTRARRGANLKREAEGFLADAEHTNGGGNLRSTPNHAGGIDLEGAAELWRTPSSSDNIRGAHPEPDQKAGEHSLNTQATQFPTPAQRDYRSPNLRSYQDRGGQMKGEQLQNFIQHAWPTPNSSPSAPNASRTRENGRIADRINEQCLETLACSLPDHLIESNGPGSSVAVPTSPRRLNPKFVEWLQGLPEGWTSAAPINSEALETWLSQSRARLACYFSLIERR